ERAKQRTVDRFGGRVLGRRKLVRSQSALEQPKRTVTGSSWVKRDSPSSTTLRQVFKLEAGVAERVSEASAPDGLAQAVIAVVDSKAGQWLVYSHDFPVEWGIALQDRVHPMV